MCLRDEDNMGGVVSIVHLGAQVVLTFSYPKEGTKLTKVPFLRHLNVC